MTPVLVLGTHSLHLCNTHINEKKTAQTLSTFAVVFNSAVLTSGGQLGLLRHLNWALSSTPLWPKVQARG